jgi:TRAP-type mannitol/chloroaromatic compound transport system permease small subunit
VGEREISTFASPLYITKSLIPLGAVLMFLQGIAKYVREYKTFKEGE